MGNLVARQINGLIVASSMLSASDYVKLNEQCRWYCCYTNDTKLPLVITDAVTPTADRVEQLASSRPDEVYFLGGQPRLSPTKDRFMGFMQGLERAGVTSRPEWIIHGNYHPSSGYESSLHFALVLAVQWNDGRGIALHEPAPSIDQ